MPSATTGWDEYLTKSVAISPYTEVYTSVSCGSSDSTLRHPRVQQQNCRTASTLPPERSFPLSCLSASVDTYTITASPPRRYYYRRHYHHHHHHPPPLLLPRSVRDTSTTVVSDLHHHHHHVRPAPAPKRRRAPSSPRYESVGRHEPRVLGLPVFIRS